MSAQDPSLTYQAIDIDKYFRLLSCSTRTVAGIGICANDGTLLQSSTRGGTLIARGVEQVHARMLTHADFAVALNQAIDRHHFVACARLRSNSEDTIGFVVVVAEMTHNSCLAESADSINPALLAVAGCIANEYDLVNELGSMAGELTERYEELNLIYSTDDRINQISQGRPALQHLVMNCVEYLEVGFAAIIMADDREPIFHCTDVTLSANSGTTLHKLSGKLYEKAAAEKNALVLNDVLDAEYSALGLTIPCKLLCCPVWKADATIAGILVTLKRNHLRDFTNSDRNLLDVMARKASKIIQMNYDCVTGLLNWHGFENHLSEALALSRESGTNHCILHIDVDQMQVINDIAGQEIGDKFISRIGALIRDHVRDTDSAARLEGDKFGILLHKCPLEQGRLIADNLRKKVSELEFSHKGTRLDSSVCIGVALITANTGSHDDIMTAAQLATRSAKEVGKDRTAVYYDNNDTLSKRRDEMHWVSDLQQALRADRFELQGQLIQPLNEHVSTFHFEVLLRLIDDENARVSPGVFMPAAERYHLMPAIDRWVINHTLQMLDHRWPELRPTAASWSINLSGQSFGEQGFLKFVIDRLRSATIEPERICFEITETAAVANMNEAIDFISALRELGCRFSLDDFGKGMSSFTYLKQLPVDYLKIDGEFVKNIIEDPASEAMVKGINDIGHAMELKTVAEFVENDAIAERLQDIGVDYAQGYGIDKPSPLHQQIDRLLSAHSTAA